MSPRSSLTCLVPSPYETRAACTIAKSAVLPTGASRGMTSQRATRPWSWTLTSQRADQPITSTTSDSNGLRSIETCRGDGASVLCSCCCPSVMLMGQHDSLLAEHLEQHEQHD